MPTPNQIQIQIKAIIRHIQTGKCKNVYSATNKVKSLQDSLKLSRERERWNNFLSQ